MVGAIFMALHAAQGPTLGVPQMVQTRGQFGSLGSLLVVGIVIVMYVGFLASNLVLCGESLAGVLPGVTETPGIIVVGILSVLAAIYGYDLIHAYTRLMSYVAGAVLFLAIGWIIWVHGLPANFLSRNAFNWTGFLGHHISGRRVADRLRALCVRLLALHAARTPACVRHSGPATGAAPWDRCCR